MVRVDDPGLVQKASQDLGELVQGGVVFSSQGGFSNGPTYLFSKLNDLNKTVRVVTTVEYGLDDGAWS